MAGLYARELHPNCNIPSSPFRYRWSPAWVEATFLLIVGIVVTALLRDAYQFKFSAFSPDSASYIEAARSILRLGVPMVSAPLGGIESLVPLTLWPPGYPMVIAALSGIAATDAASAAVWVTRAARAVLPLASWWAVRDAAPRPLALSAGILAATSPGLFYSANLASSDAPFALLVAISSGFLLRAERGRATHLLAGVTAGCSLWIRNAGLALLAAHFGFLAVMALTRRAQRSRALGDLIAWSTGALAPVAGLVAFNGVVLGSATTYQMGPSTVPVATNIGHFLAAAVIEIAPSYRLANAVAIYPWIAVGLILPALLYLACRLAPRMAYPDARFRLCAYAIFVFLAFALLTIAARTRYEWGEFIGPRHVAPAGWLAIIGCAALAVRSRPNFGVPVAHAVLAVAVLLAIWRVGGEWRRMTAFVVPNATLATSGPDRLAHVRQWRLVHERDADLDGIVPSLGEQCDIASNIDDVIRIRHAMPARRIDLTRIERVSAAPLARTAVLVGRISADGAEWLNAIDRLRHALNGYTQRQITPWLMLFLPLGDGCLLDIGNDRSPGRHAPQSANCRRGTACSDVSRHS